MSDFELPVGSEQDGSRPVSRRGKSKKTFANGPSEGDMQGSKGSGRPPSSQNLVRRTTARLTSATSLAGKMGQSIVSASNINVLDRPITQQGVTGLRTAAGKGAQFRQVLDKRYYEGLIRMKMKDINTEIGRLNGEIDLELQQQAASQSYEKKVREVASELTKLQGDLADYNLVIDKVNTSTEKGRIDEESGALRAENERRTFDLDELYGQTRMKEEEVHRLETEIQNEKDTTRKLIDTMNDGDKQKYEDMKSVNQNLLKEIEKYQQQLDHLTGQKLEFEERISGSQIRRETVRLYHKLKEREERKASLIEEERTRSTPAQEREKLLRKVKEDNAEMAAMDRQISQINEQIKKKKEELEMVEQDLEDSQSDKQEKFKELKKREESLEQFLSTFQESKNNEAIKIDELEKKIVTALQQTSKKLKGNVKLPGRDEFNIMKETLTMKEEELKNSKLTVDKLNEKREQLSANMKKVGDLERKIQQEITEIQEKAASMTEDLIIFSDVEGLKSKAKTKQDALALEKNDLNSRKVSLVQKKAELQAQNDRLTKELNENETYVQLNNLEKKLKLLQQSNASTTEFIESKKTETEYEGLKKKALQSLHDYNQNLISTHAK